MTTLEISSDAWSLCDLYNFIILLLFISQNLDQTLNDAEGVWIPDEYTGYPQKSS